MSAVTPRRPFHERVLSLPLRRLDVRIVLLFLVLLIAVQAASFFTTVSYTHLRAHET